MVEFFYNKLGNAYVVGLGDHEIAKIWFSSSDNAKSPLTREEAKEMAKGMCDLFNNKYDTNRFSKEEYGDSEDAKMKIKFMDTLCEMV